ncbi:MAG: LabA-like NYN domain-containing protein, partial [Aeromicrobium sp.]
MSKNVAVFVDVANIFYAAKAAGVDIDYVTLLKAATANRDFVRAYAYTGLDPENENQRQFHSFLARSGYKVISKDIRKYGDGRIKANLDIELVVDMMKTARNLDIAVVVSGDGDFAPAIRAVQEMGVRCEVISFRGNTSSDLIDVADQFTDIAQIARVEKGSARSGRRVAAEGDLSMTEVPEKETEGAPRRRRGGRTTREERIEEAVEALPGNLVVLPGERLSRAPDEVEDLEQDAEAEGGGDGESADGPDAVGEDGRRRRRRRGGRGRGRGRRPDEEAPAGEEVVAAEGELDEEFEDVAPTQLPHHTFGSVWDSQLGVAPTTPPTTPMSASLGGDAEDEDLDEPEVPEYLLAERRQRGQRPGRGGSGGGGARSPRGRSSY